MNWFRRSPSSSAVQTLRTSWSSGTCSTSSVNGVVDVSAWLEAFVSHWNQAYAILQANPSPSNVEQVTAVSRHLDQMVLLLLTEVNTNTDTAIGPVMDYLFTENIFEKVTLWMSFAAETDLELSNFCKRTLLKMYENVLSQAQQCLLVHKPILTPILQLLEDCSRTSSIDADIEKAFVLLLNQICVKIADHKDHSPLLEFFFTDVSEEGGPPKFMVFSMLIPYLYDEGNVGQLARDALLLILSVSRRVDSVGSFVAEHSNFCPVLATGLSALFSSLPRRLNAESDDWHRITAQNIEENAELKSFYNALEFCNAVVQVGHRLVLDQLLDFIYQGFLVPVMGSALLENSSDELVTVTAYLELFFRTVTETPLMRVLLKFLINEQYDGVTLMETLVTRISSNSKVCIVSLSLFETLLDLHCEDLVFELILKYLVPCTHLMVSQASHVTDVDHYGRSAEKFLSLIPRCCATLLSNDQNLSSASSAGSLEVVDDYYSKEDNNSNGYQTRASTDPDSRPRSSSSTTPVQNSNHLQAEETVYEFDAESSVKPMEVGYLEYLIDARWRVRSALDSCRCWTLTYDGKTPDPKLLRNLETSSSSSCGSSSNGSVVDDDNPASFQRQSSFRKSRANRYYNARHDSLLTNTNRPQLNNLALGDDETKVSNGDADLLRRNSKDANSVTPDSGPSSLMSTPRNHKDLMSTSMVDYLKLSYDEDSMLAALSDSQDDSPGAAPWVLRGWSQIQDPAAFLEILSRVRVSHTISHQPLDETLGYISGVYDSRCKSPDDDEEEKRRLAELVQSKDSGFDQQEGVNGEVDDKVDESLIVARSLPKSSFSSPDIGPFLSILLHKLENMLQNSLFTNLHLTGVISKLACYPQPLITSFLLNTSLVFQPSIRSLHQVLSALRHKVDTYACNAENFESLLVRGQKFLFTRDKRYQSERRRSRAAFGRRNEDGETLDISLNKSIKPKTEKKTGISQFFNLQSSTFGRDSSKRRSESLGSSGGGSRSGYKFQHQHRQTGSRDSLDSSQEATKTKNVVYCAIVLEEFLKELAAISLEHSVRHTS